ncbi:unnamed protein product [Mytilus coruscus]|uniref:Mab-21-like HhH/H2TH-like domain-containing protein n=1 Tax=Mytilus coruscus TaxID=42192 RepID=A0A6J8DRG9_MYTCO|nr:unnamed protein product [Mytilus coruscus]
MSENKTESLQFYKYLCQKIGSKEVVRARRLLFISNDFGSNHIQISSGSRGEGLDLNGSDFDVMHIDPYYIVYESGKYAVQDQKCVIQLTMDTEESQPCFTYLRLLNDYDNLPQPFKQVFFQHNGNNLLSSELFKLQQLNNKYKCPILTTIHGPCLSNYDDAVSGWLKLASFFYVHKNYFASIAIINYTLSKCSDDKILIGQLSFSLITLSTKQKYDLILMTQEKLISVLKTKTIIQVIFKSKSSVIPTELKFDVMERPTNFEPVTFAHFLHFLCYFHLQDYASCWFCISQLLQTILKHRSSKGEADPKSWITLGIAYQMLGLTDLAKTLFCHIAQNDEYKITSAAFRLSHLS